MTSSYDQLEEEKALRLLGAPPRSSREENYKSTEVDMVPAINKQIDEVQKDLDRQLDLLGKAWNEQQKNKGKRTGELIKLISGGKKVVNQFSAMREYDSWVKNSTYNIDTDDITDERIKDLSEISLIKNAEDAKALAKGQPLAATMIDNATDSYRAWPTDRMELEHHFYQHFPYMMGQLKEISEYNLSEALGYNLLEDGSPFTMRLRDANTAAEFLYMYDRNVALLLTKYSGVVTGKDGKLRKKFAREVAKQRNVAYTAFLASTGKAEQAVQLEKRAKELRLRIQDNPEFAVDFVNAYASSIGSYALAKKELADRVETLGETGELGRDTVEQIGDTVIKPKDGGEPTTVRDYWKKEFAQMQRGVNKFEKGLIDADKDSREAAMKVDALDTVNKLRAQEQDGPLPFSKYQQAERAYMVKHGITDPALIPDTLKNYIYAEKQLDASLAQQYENRSVLTERDIALLTDPALKKKYKQKVTGYEDVRDDWIESSITSHLKQEGEVGRTGVLRFALKANATSHYDATYAEVYAKTGSHAQAQSAAMKSIIDGLNGKLKEQNGEKTWNQVPFTPEDSSVVAAAAKVKASILKDSSLISSDQPWENELPHLVNGAKFMAGQSSIIPNFYYQFTGFINKIPDGKGGYIAANPQNLLRHRLESVGILENGKITFPEDKLPLQQQILLADNTPSTVLRACVGDENEAWLVDTLANPQAKENGAYDAIKDKNGEYVTLDKPLTQHTFQEVIGLIQQDYDDFGIFDISTNGLLDAFGATNLGLNDLFDAKAQQKLLLARLKQKSQTNQKYSTLSDQYRRLVLVDDDLHDEFEAAVGKLSKFDRINTLSPACAKALVDGLLQ